MAFTLNIKLNVFFCHLLIVPLYKKRRDTFKRTKTTGVIQSSSGRKTGRAQYSSPAPGIRQDTSASFTSSATHLGQPQYSLSQNEGIKIVNFLISNIIYIYIGYQFSIHSPFYVNLILCIDPNQTSFEGQTQTINTSQQSEILADFSRSSNSATYQTTSIDGLENSLLHGSIEQLNLPTEPELGNESIDKSMESKEEVAWIDYHPPPKDEKNNLYNI